MALFEVTDVAGLSKPLTKLINVISKGCGTLYRPRAIRKEAEAEAEKRLLLGEAELTLEFQRAEMQLQFDQKGKALATPLDNIADRARARLANREIQRQSNLETIADIAYENMPNNAAPEEVDHSWSTRFFNAAEDISEPEMQQLWGKILAGEVTQPGSYSLKTLEVLKSLSQTDAIIFQAAVGLSFSKTYIFKIRGRAELSEFGLTFDGLLLLRDAGLIYETDMLEYTFSQLPKKKENTRVLHLSNNGINLLVEHPSKVDFKFQSISFTTAGKQLAQLIPHSANLAYLKAWADSVRHEGYTFSILESTTSGDSFKPL